MVLDEPANRQGTALAELRAGPVRVLRLLPASEEDAVGGRKVLHLPSELEPLGLLPDRHHDGVVGRGEDLHRLLLLVRVRDLGPPAEGRGPLVSVTLGDDFHSVLSPEYLTFSARRLPDVGSVCSARPCSGREACQPLGGLGYHLESDLRVRSIQSPQTR